jgi:methionyl-tRNA formyltransferase
MSLGSSVVVETVEMIEGGKINPINQQSGTFRPAPKLNKENCRINWNNPAQSIYNHIRGLNPYPGAWTVLENNKEQIEVKIYDGLIIEESHQYPIGHLVISKKKILVALKEGFFEIQDLKLAGKRRMETISLLNGYEFHNGSKVF